MNSPATPLSPAEAQAVARDPAVQEVVRAQIQADEVARFQRAEHGVIDAYALFWALVVAFLLMLLRFQWKLRRRIADLEAKLGVQGSSAAAGSQR